VTVPPVSSVRRFVPVFSVPAIEIDALAPSRRRSDVKVVLRTSIVPVPEACPIVIREKPGCSVASEAALSASVPAALSPSPMPADGVSGRRNSSPLPETLPPRLMVSAARVIVPPAAAATPLENWMPRLPLPVPPVLPPVPVMLSAPVPVVRSQVVEPEMYTPKLSIPLPDPPPVPVTVNSPSTAEAVAAGSKETP
jgi:hypothetical protein